MADPIKKVSQTGTVVSGVPVAINNNVIMNPTVADNGQGKTQDLAVLGGQHNGGDKEKDLGKIVDSLNRLLEVSQAEVRFSTFKDPNAIVVRLIEQSSGKVIREIPSVKMLQIVHSLMETMGIMVDEKA